MSKWWSIGIIVMSLLVVSILYYYVSNGLLLTICTLPYILWWGIKSRKMQYLAIPVITIVVLLVIFLIPLINVSEASEDITFFYRMYQLIYPMGWNYTWKEFTPSELGTLIGIVICLILWIKVLLYFGKKINRKLRKTNFMLFLSMAITYLLFCYSLINLIPSLFPNEDFFMAFKDFFVTSLIYDILFVWIPFIVMFFIVEAIIKEITGR